VSKRKHKVLVIIYAYDDDDYIFSVRGGIGVLCSADARHCEWS